jgi:phage gp45-like
MADMITIIRREINKRFDSAVNLIRKGVLTLVADSYLAQWEANDGELYDESEFWQSFGFASRPPPGGEVLFANLGGHGEHAIGFASNDRAHRPASLASGDSVHYASSSGGAQAKAHAKAAGNYEITAGTSGHVHLTPGTGTVNIGGDATACTDYLLMGTTFDTALRYAVGRKVPPTGIISSLLNASVELAAVHPTTSTALASIADALDTLMTGSYLATKGKVK